MRTRTSPVNSRKFLPIVKIPAGRRLSLIFHDPEPTLVVVHRYQRKTIECLGPDCPFDKALFVAQDRIFARVHVAPSGAPGILELPPSHWERLVDAAKQPDGLCAGWFTFWRTGTGANGPIHWTYVQRDRPLKVHTFPGELLESLSQIWDSNTQFALSALEVPNWHAHDRVKTSIGPRPDAGYPPDRHGK